MELCFAGWNMEIRNLKTEHQTLLSLIAKTSDDSLSAEQRTTNLSMLRNALVSHTESEARYFYDCVDKGYFTDGFVKLFEDNFTTVYYEVLDVLDSILECVGSARM